jgi:hypothetical protein
VAAFLRVFHRGGPWDRGNGEPFHSVQRSKRKLKARPARRAGRRPGHWQAQACSVRESRCSSSPWNRPPSLSSVRSDCETTRSKPCLPPCPIRVGKTRWRRAAVPVLAFVPCPRTATRRWHVGRRAVWHEDSGTVLIATSMIGCSDLVARRSCIGALSSIN